MRNEGIPNLPVDRKILTSSIFFKCNHNTLKWMTLSWNFLKIFRCTLRRFVGNVGNVKGIIYVVNRSSFIVSCSLACLDQNSPKYELFPLPRGRKHKASSPQKPLRFIRDGEVGGREFYI